jgi:hypothetical protein
MFVVALALGDKEEAFTGADFPRCAIRFCGGTYNLTARLKKFVALEQRDQHTRRVRYPGRARLEGRPPCCPYFFRSNSCTFSVRLDTDRAALVPPALNRI